MVLIAFILIAANTLLSGQCIEDGWKGIRPLQTNRIDVEKVTGPPKPTGRGWYYVDYETNEADVEVNYSTAPCTVEKYDRGIYTVPEGTVIDYQVKFKVRPRLSDLNIERKNYQKDTSGDALNYATYRNNPKGITITVIIVDNEEFVQRIEYRASAAEAKKFECPPKTTQQPNGKSKRLEGSRSGF